MYRILGCNKKTMFFSKYLMRRVYIKDFRNIFILIFQQILGVPQEGSTCNKLDFQVAPIALLLGV